MLARLLNWLRFGSGTASKPRGFTPPADVALLATAVPRNRRPQGAHSSVSALPSWQRPQRVPAAVPASWLPQDQLERLVERHARRAEAVASVAPAAGAPARPRQKARRMPGWRQRAMARISKAQAERRWEYTLLDGRAASKIRRDFEARDGRRYKQYWVVVGRRMGHFLSDANHLFPLYNAEAIANAPPGRAVVVCEGEPATDALAARGRLAVGTPLGAAFQPSTEALKALHGRPVLLWPDNDRIGQRHMDRLAQQLVELGHEDIRVVDWKEAPPKGDAADFTGAEDELTRLLQEARPWEAPEDDSPVRGLDLRVPASPVALEQSLEEAPPEPRLAANALLARKEASRAEGELATLREKVSAGQSPSLRERLRLREIDRRVAGLMGERGAIVQVGPPKPAPARRNGEEALR